MATAELDLSTSLKKHADDLCELWPCRVLIHTRNLPINVIVLSVLAHNYDDAMPVFLKVTGFDTSKAPPFMLCSAGRIAKSGAIVADVVCPDGTITKRAVLYRNERALRNDFRKLADKMKLSDDERTEMFKAVQRWVVADSRYDPTFDPQDPDARRLIN